MSYVLTCIYMPNSFNYSERWYTYHYVHFTEETGARSGQFAQGHPARELTSACCCCCSFASSCSFPHFVNSTPVFSWEITPSHRFVYVVPMGPTSLTALGEGWDSSPASQPIRLAAVVQDEPIRSKDTAEALEVCCPAVTSTWDVSKYDVSIERVKRMKAHSRPHAPDPIPKTPTTWDLVLLQLRKYNTLPTEFLTSLAQFELHFSTTCNWKRLKTKVLVIWGLLCTT